MCFYCVYRVPSRYSSAISEGLHKGAFSLKRGRSPIANQFWSSLTCKPFLPLIYFVVFSGWTISPVLSNFSSCLPVRNHYARAVPIFNAWTIWWNADRLSNGLLDYWNAPIFFPGRDAFAYSEPQPITMIVSPLVWLTRSPAAAYNMYLLISLTLNGYVSFRVFRRLSCSSWLSLLGGSMIVWLPVSLREIEVLQLVPVWPIIWFWDSFRRYGNSGRPLVGLEAAVSVVICFYSCVHHALFLALSFSIAAWPLFRLLPPFRDFLQTCLLVLPCITMIGIVGFPMKQALDSEQFHRSEEIVQQLSATAESLITVPRDSLLAQSDVVGKAYSPGWIKLSLAVMGCIFGVLRAKRRRWAIFLGLTILVCALLASGPNLRFADIHLWQELGDWVPGIRQVRNVFRFVYLFQIAVIFLAVLALQELKLRLLLKCQYTRFCGLILIACGVLALIEVPAPSISLVGVPNLVRHLRWSEFIKTQTSDGRGIACLPFAAGTGVADFEDTVRWMYLGSLHGKPLVNGYSGFFPNESLKLNELISQEGLTSGTLARLWTLKVQFVVLRREDSIAATIPMLPAGEYALVRVFRDSVGIDVYELFRVSKSSQRQQVD